MDHNSRDELFSIIIDTSLSIGAIINVVQECAIHLISSNENKLDKTILNKAITKELKKEGYIL